MRNLSLLADMYELTMLGGYIASGKQNQQANFDYFFRKVPDAGGYCVTAGLEQLIGYIQHIRFSARDLAYLEGLAIFPEKVLRYLENFHFSRGPVCRSRGHLSLSRGTHYPGDGLPARSPIY